MNGIKSLLDNHSGKTALACIMLGLLINAFSYNHPIVVILVWGSIPLIAYHFYVDGKRERELQKVLESIRKRK